MNTTLPCSHCNAPAAIDLEHNTMHCTNRNCPRHHEAPIELSETDRQLVTLADRLLQSPLRDQIVALGDLVSRNNPGTSPSWQRFYEALTAHWDVYEPFCKTHTEAEIIQFDKDLAKTVYLNWKTRDAIRS
ncbi:MAG: hypothetical protein K8L99_15110 [Anaerolineae bacterium]|nr:hypothetical protein [Anaerolineae bacterium]